jgi:hypothetical protein
MVNLSNAGRVFYGVSIAEIGLQAIYLHNFPYIFPIPGHFSVPVGIILACLFGAIFTLAGVGILFQKRTMEASLLFAGVLLLLFCFYYIPYEFLVSPNYMHLEDWENAEKELAFAGGALAIAACFPATTENKLTAFLAKLAPLGPIIFSIPMIGFGILHFLVAKDAATMVPSWIPWHLFWIYFCGAALIGSGIAIIFKIKRPLFAGLLGLMIFLWFVLLHIPELIAAPAADKADEITSACLALAYSGIAFVISGIESKKSNGTSYTDRRIKIEGLHI